VVLFFVWEFRCSNSNTFSSSRAGEVTEFHPTGPAAKDSASFKAFSTVLHMKKETAE
jgi:hypothetical protein